MEQIILIGGGKFAGLIYSAFKDLISVCGYIDDIKFDKAYIAERYNIPFLGTTENINKAKSISNNLCITIGSEGNLGARIRYFNQLDSMGFNFPTLIHPTALLLGDNISIGKGSIIQHNVAIQPDVSIGINCYLAARATICHNCSIKDHVFIAAGTILNGSVVVGEGSFIGSGANIIQKISIGKNSIVAASACVTKNVNDNSVVKGIPAKS
jgi:sugar O-acyltransferase (sialic acid O-acetyltransferase NeuD family)